MILDMLKQHNEKEKASFHMPGHKNGNGFCEPPYNCGLFAFDTTELPGTDALIHPEGTILEAEQFAAKLYGAKHSFFLVNGSTGGILAMIYCALSVGDKVIVDRNCHQSVVNGLTLTGAVPIYVSPEASALDDVPGTVSPEAIAQLLKAQKDIKAAIITAPNYYGATADIKAIADLLHEHNALLLVDEAHGAHFPFCSALPDSAIRLGADMSVVSLHKTLPSPNQTALLHIGKNISAEKARRAIFTFQTSSPSYVLLATMEYALHAAAHRGESESQQLLSQLSALNLPTLNDPFKLLPSWAHKGISGYEAEEILRETFGIYVELCNTTRILCMTSWCNTREDIEKLAEGAAYLDALPQKREPIVLPSVQSSPVSTTVLSPQETAKAPKKMVPLREAKGKVCASSVSAFPPCIPILLPGEVISEEQITSLIDLQNSHATITGLSNNCIEVVL